MTSHDLSCPRCSAHVSPDADWCTLCFADLRVPPVAEAAPEPETAVETAVETLVEPVATPEGSAQPAGAGRGKHARSATSYDDAGPTDAAESAALGASADEMLARLAAESGHRLGPLADRLESTGARAVAAAFGAVLLLVVGLLVMTLLGHFV